MEVEKGKGAGNNTNTGHSNTAISSRTVQSSMTGSDGSIAAAAAQANVKVPRVITVDPDATPDLKHAMEIIEAALTLTNGSNENNNIPLSLRHKLLTLWIYLRQLLNINVPRNLSHEHDDTKTPTLSASKAVTAVEMISSSRNGLGEFANCPTLNDVSHILSFILNKFASDSLPLLICVISYYIITAIRLLVITYYN